MRDTDAATVAATAADTALSTHQATRGVAYEAAARFAADLIVSSAEDTAAFEKTNNRSVADMKQADIVGVKMARWRADHPEYEDRDAKLKTALDKAKAQSTLAGSMDAETSAAANHATNSMLNDINT